MSVLGIDIGGSTTKIVAFNEKMEKVSALQVRATDQITSMYGAIGHMLHNTEQTLSDISDIILTGVGATLISGDIYGIPTARVKEFEAIGRGGLMLSGLDEALVVSMGTGTAFVHASAGGICHIGGSGVGGGTLVGLSSKLLNETDIEAIVLLASQGCIDNVDLSISEISNYDTPSLPSHATASNFGKIKSQATRADIAIGLMNTVFQTAGIMSVFACRSLQTRDVVVTGSIASLPQAKPILNEVGELYGVNFIIPDDAIFATAIGAALAKA